MEDKSWIIIIALIMLTLIEMYVLYLGINGIVLASVIGIFGFAVGVPAGLKISSSNK